MIASMTNKTSKKVFKKKNLFKIDESGTMCVDKFQWLKNILNISP